MKRKAKFIALGVLTALFLGVIVFAVCFSPKEGRRTASAATYVDGRYRLDLDVTMQMIASAPKYDYEVYLYGNSSADASEKLPNGATLGFAPTKLEIVIPAGSSSSYHTYYGRVYNVKLDGAVSFSSDSVYDGSNSDKKSVSFTLSGLTGGKYTLSFSKDEYYWSSTSIGGTHSDYRRKQDVTFTFTVDIHTHYYEITTVPANCTVGGYTLHKCSCGSSYKTDETPALGHSYTAKTTSPSCTADGYTTYSCTRCGNSYTGNKTSALGHSLSATRSISCTTETTVYACARCNYSTVSTGEGYGHNYVPSVTEPTCTSGGYTIFTCSNCGDSYRDNETQPLGHNYSITQNNSCTGGTTTYKCSRCGKTYSEDTQGGTGHIYVASTTAPTCVDRGFTIYTCSRCGDSYRDNETQALGHNYVPSVVSPTCTASGFTVYTCSRCESSYRSGETQATGHRYVSSSHPATCSEGGYTLHECEICGVNYRDNETQPLGHNFVTSEVPSSCTEGGKTVQKCQVCGYEISESDGSLPTGHDYTNTVVRAATCTEEGVRKCVCDICGYSYEMRIPAAGHNYQITDVRSSNGNTRRTYNCSTCGETYIQELGDQYEEVSNYVEYLFQQYQPYMIWVFLATAGVWSIAIGVALIIAHKNEDKEKAKKMLVNYAIGLVVIFCIIVACPFLVRGIASLIT